MLVTVQILLLFSAVLFGNDRPLPSHLAPTCQQLIAYAADGSATRFEITPIPEVDQRYQVRMIETLIQKFNLDHGGVRSINRLAVGGESIVLLVQYNDGTQKVVKIPRTPNARRSARAVAHEAVILRAARDADPEGARQGDLHLPDSHVIRVVLNGRRILGTEMAYTPLGTVGSLLASRFGTNNAKHNPRFFLEIYRQMALAVRSLHRAEYVHRDVKPDNFLVFERDGHPYVVLTDLTLAAHEGGHAIDLESSISGTLTHMSDNQLAGGTARFLDDLHGLRLSLAEMLMGRSIWELDSKVPENHIDRVFVQGLTTHYPRLTQLPSSVADVPIELQNLFRSSATTIDAFILEIDTALQRFPIP